MLKWLFGSSSENKESAEAEAPKLKSRPQKAYGIFRGPNGLVAAIETDYSEYLPIPGMDGRPAMKDGKPLVLKTSGSAFNTTALDGFIKGMEKLGYDMAHEKKILDELKTATEAAGLTDQMAKVRLTGHLIGDPKTGQVLMRDPVPVDLKGQSLICIYPDIERPGYLRAMKFTL